MQKIDVRHDFPGMTEDQWFQIYLDDDFNRELEARLDVKERKVLSSEQDGDIVRRKVKMVPNIPAAFKKFVKDGMSVEESSTVYLDRHHVDWSTHVGMAADKFKSAGVLYTQPAGDGCRRVIEGTVEVKIPLVGKKIEKKIIETINQSYEIATALMKEWLAKI